MSQQGDADGLKAWALPFDGKRSATQNAATSAPGTQKLVGHNTSLSTQRYADVDADDIRAALALLDGETIAVQDSSALLVRSDPIGRPDSFAD